MIPLIIITLAVVIVCAVVGAIVGSEVDSYEGSNYSARGAIVGGAIAAVLAVGFYAWSFGTEDTVTVKVAEKQRIQDGQDSKWLIVAADGTTYENTDAWFHGKTHSTDLQADLKVGRTYRCTVNGVRSGLMSSYRNLLSCTDVATGKPVRS